MRVCLARVFILSICILAVSAAPARGQSPTLTSLPPFVRVTGSFSPADGKPPAPVETMTLSVYGEATGGVPLWQELGGSSNLVAAYASGLDMPLADERELRVALVSVEVL